MFLFPGVADGVGGWRNYGIDAGEFSNFLMRTCERLVQSSNFNPQHPVELLAGSYYELLEHKKPILGEPSISRLAFGSFPLTGYSLANCRQQNAKGINYCDGHYDDK
jgi:hypothetical protein